jgi:hypothetical protein
VVNPDCPRLRRCPLLAIRLHEQPAEALGDKGNRQLNHPQQSQHKEHGEIHLETNPTMEFSHHKPMRLHSLHFSCLPYPSRVAKEATQCPALSQSKVSLTLWMNSERLNKWATAASASDSLTNNDLAAVLESPVDEPQPFPEEGSSSVNSVFTLSVPVRRDELDEDQGKRAFDFGIDTLTTMAMENNPPSPEHVVISYEGDIGQMMIWEGNGEFTTYQSHTTKTHPSLTKATMRLWIMATIMVHPHHLHTASSSAISMKWRSQ